MRSQEIFNEHINLLSPYPFEYIHELLGLLGYSSKQYNTFKAKRDTLETLAVLLDLEMLKVCDWVKEPELNQKKMSKTEVMLYICLFWSEKVEFDHFYDTTLFGTQKWYLEKLEKLGMTHSTNWEAFVRDKIGDLEEWIENNRPKKS